MYASRTRFAYSVWALASCTRNAGSVTFDNFLDEEQLQYWRRAVTHAVSKRDNSHRFPNKGQEDTTNVDFSYYLNVFIQRVNLYQNDEHMHTIFQGTKSILGKVAADLQGVDAMRLWHEQALIKQPFANATAWHVDVPCKLQNNTLLLSHFFLFCSLTKLIFSLSQIGHLIHRMLSQPGSLLMMQQKKTDVYISCLVVTILSLKSTKIV